MTGVLRGPIEEQQQNVRQLHEGSWLQVQIGR